jgi:hypothetical protein
MEGSKSIGLKGSNHRTEGSNQQIEGFNHGLGVYVSD